MPRRWFQSPIQTIAYPYTIFEKTEKAKDPKIKMGLKMLAEHAKKGEIVCIEHHDKKWVELYAEFGKETTSYDIRAGLFGEAIFKDALIKRGIVHEYAEWDPYFFRRKNMEYDFEIPIKNSDKTISIEIKTAREYNNCFDLLVPEDQWQEKRKHLQDFMVGVKILDLNREGNMPIIGYGVIAGYITKEEYEKLQINPKLHRDQPGRSTPLKALHPMSDIWQQLDSEAFKWTEASSKSPLQKTISIDELNAYIIKGWKPENLLPDGRITIRLHNPADWETKRY